MADEKIIIIEQGKEVKGECNKQLKCDREAMTSGHRLNGGKNITPL